MGVRDVAALAEILVDAHRLGLDIGSLSVLDNYARWRRFDNLLLHVTGFYRDIRDWVGTGFPVDTYRGLTYYKYVNKDNAVAKGITLSGSLAAGPFNFSLDYNHISGANYTEAQMKNARPTHMLTPPVEMRKSNRNTKRFNMKNR